MLFHLQPSTVVSTTMVLREQRGNCFDYAILLASLLIGVGYDAYCVCGYASQDVCLLNLGRNTCPLLVDKEEVLCLFWRVSVWYTSRVGLLELQRYIFDA